MEADALTVGWTDVISPAPQSADIPAVCPGLAGGGIHPCSLGKHYICNSALTLQTVSVELLHTKTVKS